MAQGGRQRMVTYSEAFVAFDVSKTNRAKEDRVPTKVPDHIDSATDQAKNDLRFITLSEENLPM